jgi:hypothetical protein
MSIPISTVVKVNIQISTKPVGARGFGALLFLTDERSDTFSLETSSSPLAGPERVRKYVNLEGVLEDWDTTSEVYKAANSFYAQGAMDFYVGLANSTNTAAKLSSGASLDLSTIQAVTAGGFTISINGATQNLTGLKFSNAASLSGVAAILDAAITGATVTFDTATQKLVVTSETVGGNSSVSFATADIGGALAALKLGASGGATQELAATAETPVQALAECREYDNTWYGIDMHKKWRDSDEAVDVAEYAEATKLVFFNTTNNLLTLNAGVNTDIASQLKAKTLLRTLTHFSSHADEYPSAAVAGRAFLVNFEGVNTTITLFLKRLPTITVEPLTPNQNEILKSKNANAVIDIGGNNIYSDSRMANGTWFDIVHGTDWLTARIEYDVFARLYTAKKIPYTDSGISMILQAAEQGLRQAVTNGLVAPGNDENGEYLPLGYVLNYIPVSQVAPSDKQARIYRGLSFKAIGAGALHGVEIDGTFTE